MNMKDGATVYSGQRVYTAEYDQRYDVPGARAEPDAKLLSPVIRALFEVIPEKVCAMTRSTPHEVGAGLICVGIAYLEGYCGEFDHLGLERLMWALLKVYRGGELPITEGDDE